ncbi:MAG: hypothetical protein K0R65_2747 [Crocinitomicaceae bacterium]|jgi:hypothetical protein|nr:hypothetical protein [Crocinitomicaceae bacterium]
MKNKGLTYLMLIVVGVIWYQVFFRIKSNLEADAGPPSNGNSFALSDLRIKRDTFQLAANYRDPFGGKMSAVSRPDTVPRIRKTVEPRQKVYPVEQSWVKIRYYGLIRKTDSKNPLALLNIDNEQFFLRKGDDVFDGYKIQAIYRDSVLISYGKKSKYFYKQ